MSDKLDNDLKNRIREVFDNYTDDTADAGWDLLRQKFPEEKKRRVIAWWWYSAAAVLLLCLGTWFFYPQPTPLVAHQPKQHPNQQHTTLDSTIVAGSKNAIASDKSAAGEIAQNSTKAPGITTSKQQLKGAATQQSYTITGNNISEQKPLLAATSRVIKHSAVNGDNPTKHNSLVNINDNMASANTKATESFAALTTGTDTHIITTNGYQPKINSKGGQIVGITTLPAGIKSAPNTQGYATQNMAKITPALSTPGGIETDSISDNKTAMVAAAQQPAKPNQVASVVKNQDPILKMIAADDARRLAAAKNAVKKPETKVKSDRAMMLSLYAATYFNYAKGSQSQLGVGGGVTSDFRISSNFKISTGLSIGQNRLSYSSDNNIPQQINNSALALVNKSAASSVAAYSAVSAGLKDEAVSPPSVKNYNASLVGLDIPLNIKYQFNPKKNDTYISAGISSGTYINESYRSTYSYGGNYNSSANFAGNGLNALNNTAQQTQESTTNQHFGSFDFAKTLNLSFGVGYPMGKTTRLVIEPFLKYPLNGLGTQDIRFGASGINLKLSFSSKK
jgi:hypothetical protein